MFNPSDLLEDHHLQRFSPLPGPRNTGELTGTEQQSHTANRDRDRVHVQAQVQAQAQAQAQVAQLLRDRGLERERDGQKQLQHGHGAPQSYRDIFEMGGGGGDGAPGDRLAMRDVVERDIPREQELAIHRSNSSTGAGIGVGVGVGVGNVNVNGSTDYSEFDQFLQSTNWARMGGAGPVPNSNSHGHGHGHGGPVHGHGHGHGHGGHDFQTPNGNMSRTAPNAYPNAAMFMMGAGNMNMANMSNMNMGMFNAPMPFSMNPMMYQQQKFTLSPRK
jgi:hypothetical protein